MTRLAARIRECGEIMGSMARGATRWCYRCEMDGLMGLDMRAPSLPLCHVAYARGRADRVTLLRLEEVNR